ncbi:MmgE/PrpD family protein [Chloroflexota bacterium]
MTKFIPTEREELMRALCRMVIETKYEDLPGSVINRAKHSILDTLAVTVGGSAMEGIQTIVDFVKDRGGKPESIIPLYGGKVPASEAALAIGPMSRAMDMGDVHDRAGHASEYTLPALLAATGLKDRVNGKEFITSFVVGQEVLLRIGIAYKAGSKALVHGRNHGHFIFGCVAAVGKLLGLSLDELEEAEGIASEMTQPHASVMYGPATLMIRVHHGFICQDAINACLLAKRGITGPRRGVLDAPSGYLGFANWETDPGALTRGLGEEWEMTNVVMKKYPSIIFTQTAIDGIIDQMKEHNFKVDNIASIDIDVTILTAEPREAAWNPRTVPECQFSLPYTVATAAYNGDVFLDSYTPQARARKDVRDLMTRISMRGDASLLEWATRVNTTLKDGRKYSKECTYAKGHPQNPFTEEELIEKFKKCARYSACELNGAVIDSVINATLNLEKVDDVVSLVLIPLTPNSNIIHSIGI